MMWIMIMMALVMLIYTRALEAGHNHRWLQKKKKKRVKNWPEQSGMFSSSNMKRTKCSCRRFRVHERAVHGQHIGEKSMQGFWFCCAYFGAAHSLILMSLLHPC